MKKRIVIALTSVLVTAFCCIAAVPAFAATAISTSATTKAKAVSISVNTTYELGLSSATDQRWVKFTPSADGYITYSFTHPKMNTSSRLWYATIYASSDREIYTCGHNGQGNVDNFVRAAVKAATFKSNAGTSYNAFSYTSDKIGLKKGETYYIKVEGSTMSTSSIACQLRVNFTATSGWEKESNNQSTCEWLAATPLAVNTEIKGNISCSSDVDWYKVDIPGNGKVTLSLSHEVVSGSSATWGAYLGMNDADNVEPTKKLSVSSAPGSSGAVVTSPVIGLNKRSVYVQVGGGLKAVGTLETATYTLRVNYTPASDWEVELNDTVGTASPMSVNTWINGNLANYGSDVDWYRVVVPSSGKMTLKFKHPQASGKEWKVYLNEANARADDFNYWTSAKFGGFKWNTGHEMIVKGDTAGTASTDAIDAEPGVYVIKVEKTWNPTSYEDYGLYLDFTPKSTNSTASASGAAAAGASATASTATKVAKPKATTFAKKLTPLKKGFKATWKKKSGVTGYQIRYSTKSNM